MNRLRSYGKTISIVSLFLAIVATVQMLIFDDVFFDYTKELRRQKDKGARYEFIIVPSSESDFLRFIDDMPEQLRDYKDVTLVGVSRINTDKCNLITYYPTPDKNRSFQVINGKSIGELASGEIVCDELPGNVIEEGDKKSVKLKDHFYEVVGIGNGTEIYRLSSEGDQTLPRIYCSYPDYFDITLYVYELVIQYPEPLSARGASELNAYISESLGISEYFAPEGITPQNRERLTTRLMFVIAVTLFVLILNRSIIDFMFFKLKDEYRIRSICGATPARIFLTKCRDLFEVGIISFLLSVLAYQAVLATLGDLHPLWDSVIFIAGNMGIYTILLFIVSLPGGLIWNTRSR